ncbi:hypothetical protein QWY93_12735 [Echinicola jeungdonensis]|uniref:Uncharacterized protein n=1 Tax=Echinicola jeungdonensis TaxID=709343 RepID=A0ABV5J902_9BACT|nr:hypothetical protein [Echinicola jeungdonensis]MDN3670191.1 hypothetical protein [Echinicola jeungdonensis]
MRRLLQISLLLIYLMLNAGLSYSLHFCGEDFARINLFGEDKTCCPEGEEKPGCCDDISHIDLQNGDENPTSIPHYQFLKAEIAPVPKLLFDILDCLSQNLELKPLLYQEDNAPPEENSLHIRHQVFLI